MRQRPESSVSPEFGMFGEISFPGVDHGAVIHRTPEELGISRIVLDAPAPRRIALRPDYVEERRILVGPTRVKKDAPEKAAGVRLNARATERKKRMANAGTVTGGGGRSLNRVPVKRYGMPAVSVVEMDEVPEPSRANTGIASGLYVQIAELRSGALKVTFETEGHASYILTKLRKIATKEGETLLGSKSADGKTRWFWLEKL